MCAWQGQQYNQQHQQHSQPQHQQHSQPQQQPWQPPQQIRSSWQDPRFMNQNAFGANSSPAVPTPVSPLQTYNVPSAQNNSNWGVSFNQSQPAGYSNDNKPPLPPRPPSGLAHTSSPAPIASGPLWQASTWQNPAHQTQTGFTQQLGYGAGQQWQPAAFSNPQSSPASHYQSSPQSPPPPNPPPRPTAYQAQAHLDHLRLQHQHYSYEGAPHNVDPTNQAFVPQQTLPYDSPQANQLLQQPFQEQHLIAEQNLAMSQAQNPQDEQRPPVSPELTHVLPWNSASSAQISNQNSRPEQGSSALGVGGPSDWEHFQASADDLEDEGPSITPDQNKHNDTVSRPGYAELPADLSRTDSKRENFQQASVQPIEPASPMPDMSHVPVRERSVSPEPTINSLRRSGTIDGVIQAWSTPLDSRSARGESRKSSVSTLDRSRRDALDSIKSSPRRNSQSFQAHHSNYSVPQHSLPAQDGQERPISPTKIPALEPSLAPPPLAIKTIEIDPYADLGPEYRASLARYATTLRKEEAAPEEERYKIFKAFVEKETRLRSILYGVEIDDVDHQKPPQIQATTLSQQPSVGAAIQPTSVPTDTAALPTETHISNLKKASPNSSKPVSKLTLDTKPLKNEDSPVVVERDDQSEYSPGGRPRISHHAPRRTVSYAAPKVAPKAAASSPSDYAPMVVGEESNYLANVDPALTRHPPPRPGTAPLTGLTTIMNDPIKFEPPRPAYTPFRYTEGPQTCSEPVVASRPGYQAYSALRNQSVDSGRLLAQTMVKVTSPIRRQTILSPTGQSARREHEEAFLGLIRENSRAYRGKKPEKQPTLAPVTQLMPNPKPVDWKTEAITGLRKIVPVVMPANRLVSPRILEAQRQMAKYPDVFSWIPEIVVMWDRENKKVRKKQEDERQARQEESEKYIDGLFNDHEIGYSDIGQLESEFKLAEATKKYDEDVQELESFTNTVFQSVTERLDEELLQLKALYIRAVDVLEREADSGTQYMQGDDKRALRSEAMEIVLCLYNKMQIRYVKVAEAQHERERRRKKLELSVLYTNGDGAGMKKLEQDFSKAERQQTLHEAREKDSRANKLLDTFDGATMQGLGDNQQFVDDVVAQLHSIDILVKEKQENIADLLQAGLHDLLRSIEELLDYVATDSKSLLAMSNTVDNLLNKADYDVSVAESRIANASPEGMKILEDEKAKEDERIKAEVDTRMGSVAKGPENALSLLRSIIKRLGDDPQHQDRVQKALEAAKLRNSSKTPAQ